jgi:hypothetical protein
VAVTKELIRGFKIQGMFKEATVKTKEEAGDVVVSWARQFARNISNGTVWPGTTFKVSITTCLITEWTADDFKSAVELAERKERGTL